jgi:hypothetical protein
LVSVSRRRYIGRYARPQIDLATAARTTSTSSTTARRSDGFTARTASAGSEAAADAAALGRLGEVMRCRSIAADGTSADAQLTVYRRARDKGAERKEALAAVSEWLAATTVGQHSSGQHLQPKTAFCPPAAHADTHLARPGFRVQRPTERTAASVGA